MSSPRKVAEKTFPAGPLLTQAPASATALAQERAMARELLEDGEVIHLAIRPSLWFVPLISGPLVLGALLFAIVLRLEGPQLGVYIPPYALAMLWAMAAMARLFAGSIQWLGRLYVLTNRRLITVRGVARFRVFQCPLAKVGGLRVSAGAFERLLGLGTLVFDAPPGAGAIGPWVNLARPQSVSQQIRQAISRCKVS
jgi:hypothetical protein